MPTTENPAALTQAHEMTDSEFEEFMDFLQRAGVGKPRIEAMKLTREEASHAN